MTGGMLTAGCNSSVTPSTSSTASPAAAVASLPAASHRVVAAFKVGALLGGIAVGDGWVWATNQNSTVVGSGTNGTTPALLRIDPATNAVSATLNLPSNPAEVEVVGKHIEVHIVDQVLQVDPATMSVAGRYSLPAHGDDPGILSQLAGSSWIIYPHDGTLVRLDPTTRAPGATLRLTASAAGELVPTGVGAQSGSLWAAMGDKVARIDPANASVVATYPLPCSSTGDIEAGSRGVLWIICDSGRLLQLDAATGSTRALATSVPTAQNMTVHGDDLWVGTYRGGLWHVDTVADRVVDRVDLNGVTAHVVEDGDTLWAVSGANDLTRINAAAS